MFQNHIAEPELECQSSCTLFRPMTSKNILLSFIFIPNLLPRLRLVSSHT